jgi:glycosyltransferase involved in cell wall biosynthesis
VSGAGGHGTLASVGVNLLWCVPGVVGGSEQYVTRQLVALSEHGEAGRRVVVFVPDGFASAHPELNGRVTMVEAPTSGRSRALRVVAESTWLPRALRQCAVDVVHHGGGTIPLVGSGVASVVTVHDLQYCTSPETFNAVKLAYLRRSVPRAVRRAAVVVTPSEFVRSTVLDLVPQRDPASVIVVDHPVPASSVAPTAPEVLAKKWSLRQPVIVYPAITYRHKNHAVLVDAMATLTARNVDVRLVLLGGVGPVEREVMAAVHREGLGDRVVRTGRVSDGDRDGLIAMASALVFPSRYEGFGAPVVEAMHLGCPVLAGDATALREVVGDAGWLIDPDSPGAWAEAIERVITDTAARQALVDAGRQRAARFDGRSTAVQLDHAYALATRTAARPAGP